MRRFSSLVVVLAVAALAACGVTDTGEFREIPANEFPGGLRVTIPPTTTTTTTTTAPPGPTTTEPTVTLPPTPTEIIQVFYVQGIRVRAVSVEERTPVLVQRKLFDLTERRGMVSSDLRLATVLPAGAILNGNLKRGVTSVEALLASPRAAGATSATGRCGAPGLAQPSSSAAAPVSARAARSTLSSPSPACP